MAPILVREWMVLFVLVATWATAVRNPGVKGGREFVRRVPHCTCLFNLHNICLCTYYRGVLFMRSPLRTGGTSKAKGGGACERVMLMRSDAIDDGIEPQVKGVLMLSSSRWCGLDTPLCAIHEDVQRVRPSPRG